MTLTVRCNSQSQETGDRPVRIPSNRRSAVRAELPLLLSLKHSGELALSLQYELVGDDGPLLIVCGGISAGRHVASSDEFPEPGWWEAQKRALGLDRFRVLSIEWIGADGAFDIPIDAADQADAIASLLAELGIGKAAAFIGASYGAMVGMHFSARHPKRIGALLSISAAARSHPYSSACRSLQRQALSLGERAGDPEAGIALARAMAMLTYRTAQEFAERFADCPSISEGRVRVGADDYLELQGARHCRRMSATAYKRLSESIDLHRIDPGSIQAPLMLVAVDSDALVPAADVEAIAASLPDTRFEIVHSLYGHDAFLKEEEQIAGILTHFLSSLEDCQ